LDCTAPCTEQLQNELAPFVHEEPLQSALAWGGGISRTYGCVIPSSAASPARACAAIA
jgi:hypothetical protein